MEAGLRWHRVDFNWFRLETAPGVLDFSMADAVVDAAEAHGLILLPVLGTSPDWEQQGGANRETPRDVNKWKDFLAAVVNRYRGRIKYWEIWNEPDGAWDKGDEFVLTVAQPAYDAIKGADPEAVVVGPATINCGWLREFLTGGGDQYVDVISFHAYGKSFAEFKEWVMGPRLPWECWFDDVLTRFQITKPVWLTEFGQQTNRVSDAEQSDYLLQVYDLILAQQRFERGFLYELYDPDEPCDSVLPDRCWALLRKDWSPKQAFGDLQDYRGRHEPVPQPGPARAAAVGETVTFDGSASTDPDGRIVKYEWDHDRTDGVRIDAQGVSTSTTFARAGEYEVTLIVTDDNGIYVGGTTRVTVGGGGTQRPVLRAVRAAQPVVIDGDIDEWNFRSTVELTGADYVETAAPSGGDSDVSARLIAMWDDGALYVAAIIKDDAQSNPNAPGEMWKGDSWQVAFDADHDRTQGSYDADGDHEVGFALINGNPATYRWTAPAGAPAWNPQFASGRAGTGDVVLEAAIPFDQLPPFKPAPGAAMGMSFLVNDDDGSGREGFVQWTPGIGSGKDPSAFGDLILGGGPCESDTACSNAGDCANAQSSCACPGSWTCNGAKRCEWLCGGEDAGTTSDAGVADSGVFEDAGGADTLVTGDSGVPEDSGSAGDVHGEVDGGGGRVDSGSAAEDAPYRPADASSGKAPAVSEEPAGCSCAAARI